MNVLSILIAGIIIGAFVCTVVILGALALSGRVSLKQRDIFGGQWDDLP